MILSVSCSFGRVPDEKGIIRKGNVRIVSRKMASKISNFVDFWRFFSIFVKLSSLDLNMEYGPMIPKST